MAKNNGKKQWQFGRVLKITVEELICFTFFQFFGYSFTHKITLTVSSSKVQT